MTLKRKLVTILFILLGLYTVIGFLLVPFLIRHFGEKALQENVNEVSQIEKVRLNPFALKIQIEGLSTGDVTGAWSAKWRMAEVNLSALTILKFYPVFDNITLDGADIEVARRVSETEEEVVEDSTAEPSGGWREAVAKLNVMEVPKLRIDLLQVSNGKATFTDETNAELYTQTIDPINFSLSDLTTVSEDATTMKFVAETATGALLSWEGNLTSQPLRSAGTFRLDGLKIDHLAPYYAEMIRFNLDSAVFGLRFDYSMDLSNLEDLFALEQGQLSLTDVVCEPMSVGDRILSIQAITVEGVGFKFPQMELGVERVGITKGNTLVRRDATGAINLLGLLAERQPDESAGVAAAEPELAAAESDLPPFSHRIDLIEVTDYTVVWEEDLSNGLAQVEVGIPSLKVHGLTSDLEKPFEIDAQYTLGDSGSLEFAGTITSATGALDLGITLKDFALGTASAYTNEFANMDIESGLLGFEGRLLNHPDQGMSVTGTASITDFAAAQGADGATQFTWNTLEVGDLTFAASPFALNIKSVRLVEPVVSMQRAASEPTEEVEAPAEEVVADATGEPIAETESATNVVIDLIQIESGSFVLNDQSVEPNAEIKMSDLALELKNLNLAAAEVATLQLDAVFNESSLKLSGELNPGALKSSTSLQFKLSNLGLPQFSSYSGQAVGRRIDKGMFTLESDWSIVENQLQASNKIVVDQLNFGDSVESEGAISLPLDLAVMLLAGPGGVMDLSLPISGDLSDPKVGIGQIVRTALVGIVTSAASAPFKLLSGLVDSEEDMSVVEFTAGDTQLSSEMVDRLNLLATALKERPALSLQMIPEISEADVSALMLAQLRAKLLEPSQLEDEAAYLKQLAERYQNWATAAGVTDAGLTTETPEGVAKMEEALMTEIVLVDASRVALATERVNQVQQHLVTSHGLDVGRLSTAETESVAEGAGLRFDLK